MKKILILQLSIAFWYASVAQIQATKQEIKSAAKQAISDFIIPSVSDNDEAIDTVYSMTKNGNTVLYEVVFSSGKVLLFSGSKRTTPLLAYYHKYHGKTLLNGFSEQHGCWGLVDSYLGQIEASFGLEYNNNYVHEGWNSLLNHQSMRQFTDYIQPMISSKWGQDISNDDIDCHAYNYFITCTSNNCHCDFIGDYCPVGCVAVAMGQIMNYWKYPVWNPNQVQQYDWCYMTDSLVTNSDHYTIERHAIAHLLIDCGTRCNMSYCQGGYCLSGANNYDAFQAFTRDFMYSNDADLYSLESLSGKRWVNKIRKELQEGRPVYYSAPSTTGGGHAFVCDGYNASGLFHFNFGWNGEGDGYYYLDELIPYGHSYFPYGHQAIMGIRPSTTQEYCDFELPLWLHYYTYYSVYGNTTPDPYANVPKTFTRLTSVPNNPQYPSTWRTIPAGATSEYAAHEQVLLQDGFLAEAGSSFHAHIELCESCEEGRTVGGISNVAGTGNDNPADTLPTPKSLQTETSFANDHALAVHPNPTDGLLSVELSNGAGIANAVLYDLQGRIVETCHGSSLQGGTATLSLNSVPAGVYVLRVTDTEGREYHRKVVKR